MPEPQLTDAPGISPAVFAGSCNRCSNHYDALYIRRNSALGQVGTNLRLCIHCVQLEATGNVHTGRGGGRRGQDTKRPYHQPAPLRMHGNKPRPCAWCGGVCIPMYSLYGCHFQACGWAHAGTWMDWVMEQVLETKEPDGEDLEYVRRSLGLKDGTVL